MKEKRPITKNINYSGFLPHCTGRFPHRILCPPDAEFARESATVHISNRCVTPVKNCVKKTSDEPKMIF